MKEKDLDYFKQNAEEDYMTTPISVLRYIRELEQTLEPTLEDPNAKKATGYVFSGNLEIVDDSYEIHSNSSCVKTKITFKQQEQ